MRLPKKHTLMASEEDQIAKSVTAVCVCVQGGATTITKVFESVSNGTPVVLVKGSGKAADLLSDAMIYYHSSSRQKGLAVWDDFSRSVSSSSQSSSAVGSSKDGDPSDITALMQRLLAYHSISMHLCMSA